MAEHDGRDPRHLERRHLNLELCGLRVEEREDAAPVVSGYAAVFNTLSVDLGPFYERIRPGAFSGALEGSDVVGLFNHKPDNLLGAERAGTLRLREDSRGLRFENDLDSDPMAMFVRRKIQRGELTGASFSFVLNYDTGFETTVEDGKRIRTILPGGIEELFDVGPVTFPAYRDTVVSARSIELAAGPAGIDRDEAYRAEMRRLEAARHGG